MDYGRNDIYSYALLFYTEASRSVFYSLGVLFSATLALFMPLLVITNSKLLQENTIIRSRLSDSAGDISTPRLFMFRCLLLIVTAAPALLTDQVEIIIGLSGSLVVPFIGFYIPVASK